MTDSRIEVFTGVVTGQTAGSTSHGPASTMAFSVYVNFPNGAQEISGIKPVSQQWDDAVTDVIPLKTGTVVLIASVDGNLQMTATMLPYVTACGSTDTGSMGVIGSIIGAVRSMNYEQMAAFKGALKL